VDFIPENGLEEMLVAMASNPELGAEFDRLLLASPLHVIGENEGTHSGAEPEKLMEGAQVRFVAIRRGDVQYLPVFTSPTRLQVFFENVTKNALIRRYITMNGRSLFQMTNGAQFLLNPGFPYGLELPASAIARLLQTQ
jgi:hypothetical protein